MGRIQGGRQPDRIIAGHRSRQEAQDERTRRQEGSQFASAAQEAKYSAQPSQHQQYKAQGPGTRDDKHARAKIPVESAGPARAMLPSAAPNTTASRAEDNEKAVSQNSRHKGFSW